MGRLSRGRDARERAIIDDNRLVCSDFVAIMKIEWLFDPYQRLERRLLRRFRRT